VISCCVLPVAALRHIRRPTPHLGPCRLGCSKEVLARGKCPFHAEKRHAVGPAYSRFGIDWVLGGDRHANLCASHRLTQRLGPASSAQIGGPAASGSPSLSAPSIVGAGGFPRSFREHDHPPPPVSRQRQPAALFRGGRYDRAAEAASARTDRPLASASTSPSWLGCISSWPALAMDPPSPYAPSIASLPR